MNNINMKAVAMKMIEQGHSNQAIASALNISRAYASMIRTDYNKFAKERIKSSREFIPAEGSKSRAVYDLILQGVEDTRSIIAETGAPHGVIHSVRIKFFNYKPKKVTYNKFDSMRTVELLELTP